LEISNKDSAFVNTPCGRAAMNIFETTFEHEDCCIDLCQPS